MVNAVKIAPKCKRCGDTGVIGGALDFPSDPYPQTYSVCDCENGYKAFASSKVASPESFWRSKFSARDLELIQLSKTYTNQFSTAGAVGHNMYLVIAHMAELLDVCATPIGTTYITSREGSGQYAI